MTTTRTNRPTSASKPPSSSVSRATAWIVGGVVVAVVAVAVLVAVLAGSDSSSSTADGGTTTVAEYQPVTVTGDKLAPQPESGEDAAIGLPAPKLDGKSFDGTPVTIDPADGKPKMVLFVAHWCPHCQREVPLLAPWLKDGKTPNGIQVYTVSTAATSQRANWPPSQWLTKDTWSAPVMADDADGSAATAYGLTGFPYFVLVGSDGKVVDRTSGEISLADLEAKLAKVS